MASQGLAAAFELPTVPGTSTSEFQEVDSGPSNMASTSEATVQDVGSSASMEEEVGKSHQVNQVWLE